MEAAIETMVSEFKEYAASDGPATTLSSDEFNRLVKANLPNYVKIGEVELMRSQDEVELTFTEFWKLIGQLVCKKEGGLS